MYDPACKPLSTFQQELWELCTRAEEASALAEEQWWTSRPLLASILACFCHVTVELFGAPLSMSEIPIRFSAAWKTESSGSDKTLFFSKMARHATGRFWQKHVCRTERWTPHQGQLPANWCVYMLM